MNKLMYLCFQCCFVLFIWLSFSAPSLANSLSISLDTDLQSNLLTGLGFSGFIAGLLLIISNYWRRSRRTITIGIALSLLSAWAYLSELSVSAFSNPFSSETVFNYPNFAIQDNHNALYVVDTAQRRLLKLDKNGKLQYQIQGGSREKGHFFYANEIAVDASGRLFVLNYVYDHLGFYLDREEILRFTADGRYDGVVYQRIFDAEDKKPEIIQRGEIFSLEIEGENLSWFHVNEREVIRYQHSLLTGKTFPTQKIQFFAANLHIADIVQADPDSFLYSDKSGRIFRVDGLSPAEEIFTTHESTTNGQQRIVPWEIGVSTTGYIYFIDLEGRSIRRLDSLQDAPEVLNKTKIENNLGITINDFDYYRLSVAPNDALVTCNDEAVIVSKHNESISYYTTAQLPLSWRLMQWSAWLIAGFFIILALWAAWLAYIEVIGRTVSPMLARAIGIILIVVIVATLSTQTAIDRLSERHHNLVMEKIAEILALAPKSLDVERFAGIRDLSDFGNSDYMYLRNALMKVFIDNRKSWSEGYYFALYKVIDERLYGFMFMNGRIGMFHPYSWLDTESVYDQAMSGRIATEVTTDVTGEWIYGVGPITDHQGKVVALFETGTDLYTFKLENQVWLRELVVYLATVLIVLVLILVEIIYVVDLIRQRPKKNDLLNTENKIVNNASSDVLLARSLAFIFFTAVSVSLAFIPLMMKDLYEPIPGLSIDVVLAIPLSLEMFGFGVASLLGGSLATLTGWKPVFYAGANATLAGLLLSGVADSMELFGLGRLLTGFGSGLVFMGLRTLINREYDIPMRNQGFSNFYSGMTGGIATGVVFGGALAERFGYLSVFLIGTILILLAILFQLIFLRSPKLKKIRSSKMQFKNSLSTLASAKIFFGNGRNLAFFVLIIFPTYIAAAFAVYYFPLFAENQGLSTGTIGLFIILGALCVIYLGPVLTNYITQTIGSNRGIVLGSVLWGGALILFALTGNLFGSVLAIIIMGIAEGFCAPVQNDVFLASPVAVALGEDQATGYFELLGKLGETVGPLTFALAMALGALTGPLVIGLLVMGCGLLFFILTQPASAHHSAVVHDMSS